MWPIQDIIKYIGLSVIIFFIIKAFVYRKVSNKYILFIVVVIMAVTLFISNQNLNCTNKIKEQFQQFTLPSDTSNKNVGLDQQVTNNDDAIARRELGLDGRKYLAILAREQQAMNKIKSNHTGEMKNTITHPFNTVPLGKNIYGYTYLPPENWFRAYEKPPICIGKRHSKRVDPMPDESIQDLLEVQ